MPGPQAGPDLGHNCLTVREILTKPVVAKPPYLPNSIWVIMSGCDDLSAWYFTTPGLYLRPKLGEGSLRRPTVGVTGPTKAARLCATATTDPANAPAHPVLAAAGRRPSLALLTRLHDISWEQSTTVLQAIQLTPRPMDRETLGHQEWI